LKSQSVHAVKIVMFVIMLEATIEVSERSRRGQH
jgi:hypothetical protein